MKHGYYKWDCHFRKTSTGTLGKIPFVMLSFFIPAPEKSKKKKTEKMRAKEYCTK